MSPDYKSSYLYRLRHSAAHVLGQAVLDLYPEGKIAIGPPTEEGFYYDFDLPVTLSDADLERIEQRMKEILRAGYTISGQERSAEELRALFAQQSYKLELIEDILKKNTDEYGEPLPKGTAPKLTTYTHANFVDLCKGPHVESLAEISPDAVKLLRVAGAYWRGDENRPMLQRVYGTAFESKQDLDEFMTRLEEARRRDHRTVGKNLDLFSFSDDVGPGLALWHPKGAMVRLLADRFSQEAHLLNGYEWVVTPHIGRSRLWETSGHLDFFKENMFSPIEVEGDTYYLKPMSCPFHIQIFKSQMRSYRDLPKRFAEFATVYRYERSGVLSGLTRVRGFTQDDAHIFCRPDQVQREISSALQFSLYVLRAFGLIEFKAYISTKPKRKAVGAQEQWDFATETLKAAVAAEGIPFEIDEGGGAFYGPKIDLKLLDCLKREWQLSTVQFDFNLPVRFGLEYVGQDGNRHVPYMVHRALFGSVERFFAMLVEHYEGAFPLWLAPVQVQIIPIADRHHEYAYHVKEMLAAAGVRSEVDPSDERMQAKIRYSQTQKIPWSAIIGDKEVSADAVAIRARGSSETETLTVEAFLERLRSELSQGRPSSIVKSSRS